MVTLGHLAIILLLHSANIHSQIQICPFTETDGKPKSYCLIPTPPLRRVALVQGVRVFL